MRGKSVFVPAALAAAASFGIAIGCASTRMDNVRIQAADDFQCPSGDVTADRIGRGRWRASGCGTVATYICSRRQCEREPEPTLRRAAPPPGHAPQTWSDEAALAALRGVNAGVMECVPERDEPLELRVELRGDGRVGRVAGLTELSSDESRCVREALSDVHIAASVDVSRIVRFAFGARSERPTPNVGVRTSEGPIAQAPVSAAPAPAPQVAAAPPDAPAPRAGESELRAALSERAEVVLACVAGSAVAVAVAWNDEGAVTVSLSGPLAGSAEEGCVRQALSALAMPAGPPGRLIHPFSP